MQILSEQNLQKGDILLSLGTSNLSQLVKLVDGGDYSHSAIWDGECVVESTLEGVKLNSYKNYFNGKHDVQYLDLYRFMTPENQPLGSSGWPVEPIIKKAHEYVEKGTNYAHNELLLLGVMVALRQHLPIRGLLEKIYEFSTHWFEIDPEGVTCSELVYLIFDEAMPTHHYKLDIRLDTDEMFLQSQQTNIVEIIKLEESEALKAEIEQVLKKLRQLRPFQENKSLMDDLKTATEASTFDESINCSGLGEMPPPFNSRLTIDDKLIAEIKENLMKVSISSSGILPQAVTPRDLQYSNSLRKIGRLK